MNEGGGPIAILNGGRLRVVKPAQGEPPYDLFLNVPIKINTDGTPDIVKNCGSVVEVDAEVNLIMMRSFDFSWNPTAYIEKDGPGTLTYNAMPGNGSSANAWGLKLTKGLVQLNQLPVQSNADSGPGDLQQRQPSCYADGARRARHRSGLRIPQHRLDERHDQHRHRR